VGPDPTLNRTCHTLSQRVTFTLNCT